MVFDMTLLEGGEQSTLASQHIGESWGKGLQSLATNHQQTGKYIVSVGENNADVLCYGTSTHYYPNPSWENIRTFVGSYDIHLNKIDNNWRIGFFKCNPNCINGNDKLHTYLK